MMCSGPKVGSEVIQEGPSPMLLLALLLFTMAGLAAALGPILYALHHSAAYGHRPDDARPASMATISVTPTEVRQETKELALAS